MTTLLVAILTSFLILTTPNTTYSLIYFLKKQYDFFDDMTFNYQWSISPGNLMLTCDAAGVQQAVEGCPDVPLRDIQGLTVSHVSGNNAVILKLDVDRRPSTA